MLGDQQGGVECAEPGGNVFPFPLLHGRRTGRGSHPSLPGRTTASMCGNGSKRCLVPNTEGGKEGGMDICRRETGCTQAFLHMSPR